MTRAASSAASGTTHGDTDVKKDLPSSGPERLVLPGLDVACRPVVEQADTEDVRREVPNIYGLSELRSGADDEADLRLEVQPQARPHRR